MVPFSRLFHFIEPGPISAKLFPTILIQLRLLHHTYYFVCRHSWPSTLFLFYLWFLFIGYPTFSRCHTMVRAPSIECVANMADQELGVRACVDCGLYTSGWCDQGDPSPAAGHCYAADWIPAEPWNPGQRTPLCSICDTRWGRCRFCRGVRSCQPFAWVPDPTCPGGRRPPIPEDIYSADGVHVVDDNGNITAG